MSLNVLVVDDSDVIRRMIVRTLGLAQVPIAAVFEAANGEEALRVLHDEWVDVVLADLNMPVMDGAELLTQMRAVPEMAGIPVIIVTTEGAQERVAELTAQGVAAWIRKPFTPEEIRDAVADLTHTIGRRNEYEALLDDVFGRVMEQFAFVFPEPLQPSEAPADDSPAVTASLTFIGAISGNVTISAPVSLCTELAANVLGLDIDDETARERGNDTLAEILNMTCGHLVTAIDPDAWSELHPPAVRPIETQEWERLLADQTSRVYLVEDQPVVVRANTHAIALAE